jgi:hypothetical protein
MRSYALRARTRDDVGVRVDQVARQLEAAALQLGLARGDRRLRRTTQRAARVSKRALATAAAPLPQRRARACCAARLEQPEAVTQAEGGLRRGEEAHEAADCEDSLEACLCVCVAARNVHERRQRAAVQRLLLRLGVVLHRGGQHARGRRAQRRMRAAQQRQQRRQAAHLGQVARGVDVLHVVLQLLCAAGARGAAARIRQAAAEACRTPRKRPAQRAAAAHAQRIERAAHPAVPACAPAPPRSAHARRWPPPQRKSSSRGRLG